MEIQNLQVLVMDNGEILCEGKTVGYIDKLGKYLVSEKEIKELKEKVWKYDELCK